MDTNDDNNMNLNDSTENNQDLSDSQSSNTLDGEFLKLSAEISQLSQKNAELNDTILRLRADEQNIRKRFEKEREEAIKYSTSKFAKDMLDIVDNFQRAVKNADSLNDKINSDSAIKALFQGILMIEKEIETTLARYGVSKINANCGDVLDPMRHQVVCEMQAEEECQPGTISQIFQEGYMHHERLLRPVMVGIAK